MGGSSATPEARLERVPPQDRLVRREALFDRLSGAPPGGVGFRPRSRRAAGVAAPRPMRSGRLIGA
jgi:hypothetical protein